MKVLEQIKKFFFITFAIFTCVTLFMVTYNLITSDVNHLVLATKTKVGALYWQVMFFSAVTALSVVIVDLFRKLNGILARLIKFLFSYGAFALWFFVFSVPAGEGYVKPSVVLVATVLFLAVYAAAVAVIGLLKWLILRLSGTKDDKYENVYEKGDE